MKKEIFDQTVNELWNNRKFYCNYDEDYVFDYPFYGELPRKLHKTFSSEVVDAIQIIWKYLGNDDYPHINRTKAEFRKRFKEQLLELGEKIK